MEHANKHKYIPFWAPITVTPPPLTPPSTGFPFGRGSEGGGGVLIACMAVVV